MKVSKLADVHKKDLKDGIRKLLAKSPKTAADIAQAFECSEQTVRATIEQMRHLGTLVSLGVGGYYSIVDSKSLPAGKFKFDGKSGEWQHEFGITTDNHLCNKQSRLDVLNIAYDHFERHGIRTALNAGNWIDGEFKFNRTELVVRPGMDSQLDYMIDNFALRKGIDTYYIAGDDHEGWYQQREGVEVGKYLELRAVSQGRKDLHYLGYAECDIALKYGSGEAVLRVVHPGGGSAYAISYTDQKRTESYQGGEKPQVEIVGHYHKFNQGYPREVHTVQCGCTCDQTLFMRKRRLQAHVGFVVIKIKQDKTGVITRFNVEWFPVFDRAYYQKRY